jgi:hypothetical protein
MPTPSLAPSQSPDASPIGELLDNPWLLAVAGFAVLLLIAAIAFAARRRPTAR